MISFHFILFCFICPFTYLLQNNIRQYYTLVGALSKPFGLYEETLTKLKTMIICLRLKNGHSRHTYGYDCRVTRIIVIKELTKTKLCK